MPSCHSWALLVLGLVALEAGGCAQEDYPAPLWAAEHATPEAGVPSEAAVIAPLPPKGVAVCRQAHAEPLPARLVVMSSGSTTKAQDAGGTQIAESTLFGTASTLCGMCHGGTNAFKGFDLSGGVSTFSTWMTPAALKHVTGAKCPSPLDPGSPIDPMPPCDSPAGGTFDPNNGSLLATFAAEVQKWFDQGEPPIFTVPNTSGNETVAGYQLTKEIGNALTNLGNCVPSPALLSFDTPRAMELDAMFAAARALPPPATCATAECKAQSLVGLPLHLSETDLFTLDSDTLAQNGVVAYSPGYPLWSDSAGKLRYVRIPRGTSIHFDKAAQKFEIPPNTRFYKTFLKEVVDTDGSYRFRKMETRLIVSRPDQNGTTGAAAVQTALFGTYIWNADETDAILNLDPLTDGKPFADHIYFYYTDENLAADLLKNPGSNPQALLIANHAGRNWAIPSSQRCIQCHMGSPSANFVLGFNPLQINRFPVGTHGVLADPPGTFGGTFSGVGGDELTQLQRFIDLGILTGIDSLSDVLPLEQSQGSRTPRNEEELTAQGYMLGNCAHCHNPRGLPSVQNPVLTSVLNFLPSDVGGVFQFPLERYSPRIFRGPSASEPIPYITPSLVDLPRVDPAKGNAAPDPFVYVNNAPPLHPKDIAYVVYAPWRSLIYRNTDDAFAYEDDLALFPHMPMNTAGFDPRARQILGDWMVSIPAIRKQPGLVEYAYRTVLDENAGDPVAIQNKDNIGSFFVDTSPQPYAEVPPGSPGYDAAKAAAQERLAIWHTGINPAIPVDTDAGTSFIYSRYADPGANDDIFDPNLNSCTPIPPAEVLFPDFGSGNTAIPPPGLPDWVDSDLTEPPGDWVPRQPNWTSILFQPSTQAFDSACLSSTTSSSDAGSPLCPPESTGNACGATGAAAAYADQLEAISLLQDTYLSQVEPFATTALPFGLWKKDPGCTFPGVPRAKQFLAASPPPHWMTIANPPLDPDAPVYTQTPGAAVFKMICVNCHGPRADASGRLALNLATMTGGNALVADWRDGIFGPVGTSEADSNRHAVFGLPGSDNPRSELPANPPANWAAPEATDDDRAARYMAWMALGGTNVTIPQGILDIVAVTPVLSEHRVVPAYALSANMLSEAKNLCYTILQPSSPQPPYFYPGEGNGYLLPRTFNALNGQLLLDIGDAEMWLQLCSTGNPSPVHVLQLTKIGQILATGAAPGALISPGTYPQGFPVGNVNGTVDSSLSPTNEWPWCVDDRLNDDGTAPTAAQINALGAADACGTKACSNVPSTDPNYDPFCDCTMHPDGCPACVCPGSVTTKSEVCAVSCPSSSGKPTCLADKGLDSECLSAADANRWAVRGAINAGLSVYLYAKSIENTTPPPDYNQCSQLTAK